MHRISSFARRRPKLAVLLVVVLALVFAGVGYAVWSLSQSTNTLQGSTASTLTLNFSTPSAGDLAAATQGIPGGSFPLIARVSNPYSAPITISSFTPSGANEFDDAGALCPISASNGLTGPAETTATTGVSPIVVPANAVNQVITWPSALSLASGAVVACKGITVVQTTGTVSVGFTAGS